MYPESYDCGLPGHLAVMRAAMMEPGVYTMSDELIPQISCNIFLPFKWILMMTSGQNISHYQVQAQLDCGPGPEIGPARKSESRGPENGVSRWRRPNSDIYSQNHHFGLVYDMIYQFLGMEAKNYKVGMFCQQCHPSVASGDADIRPRNASQIHTCHLFTS